MDAGMRGDYSIKQPAGGYEQTKQPVGKPPSGDDTSASPLSHAAESVKTGSPTPVSSDAKAHLADAHEDTQQLSKGFAKVATNAPKDAGPLSEFVEVNLHEKKKAGSGMEQLKEKVLSLCEMVKPQLGAFKAKVIRFFSEGALNEIKKFMTTPSGNKETTFKSVDSAVEQFKKDLKPDSKKTQDLTYKLDALPAKAAQFSNKLAQEMRDEGKYSYVSVYIGPRTLTDRERQIEKKTGIKFHPENQVNIKVSLKEVQHKEEAAPQAKAAPSTHTTTAADEMEDAPLFAVGEEETKTSTSAPIKEASTSENKPTKFETVSSAVDQFKSEVDPNATGVQRFTFKLDSSLGQNELTKLAQDESLKLIKEGKYSLSQVQVKKPVLTEAEEKLQKMGTPISRDLRPEVVITAMVKPDPAKKQEVGRIMDQIKADIGKPGFDGKLDGNYELKNTNVTDEDLKKALNENINKNDYSLASIARYKDVNGTDRVTVVLLKKK